MDFLVKIDVRLPPDTDAARKADLIAAEAIRARGAGGGRDDLEALAGTRPLVQRRHMAGRRRH
jgi:muconolactone delta-isomerase